MLADAFLERVNLLARQEEVLPRVGGELLGLQGAREGTESLVVCSPGTIPVGARADRGCRPLGALIEVRGARLQGGKALSFAVHVALGVGEGGAALCQLGSQGGRPFACARQLVRDSVELFAHLRQVLFEARNPGLERVERGNLHGRLVALGLQVRRRSCRRLVELRDAAHHVLMGGASVTQSVLGPIACPVQVGDLLARDLPVERGSGAGVVGRAAHGAGNLVLQFARDRRGALRDPQVVSVGCRGVGELGARRCLAQLLGGPQQGGTQQVGLPRGLKALVQRVQRGSLVGQGVGVRTHERERGLRPFDHRWQGVAPRFEGGDGPERSLVVLLQRGNLLAQARQGTLLGEGGLKGAEGARRLVSQRLSSCEKICHDLLCEVA